MNRRASILLMPAILSLGFVCSAHAATVEGTLTFPSGFVPAMTVYAREVDGTRLHSVATRESQTAFKLELPPGRYTFFAEPSQAGAPQLYGAYTQSVLCKARAAQDRCEDHSLVVIGVGVADAPAGAPVGAAASPVISDWAVPDELADELDHLLGNRTNPSVQELGAPRFSEYPSAHPDLPAPAALDYSATTLSASMQAHVRAAMPAAPDFAGSLAVARLSCGNACVDVLLIDWRNGKVLAPPQLAQITQDLPCRGDETILFRRDSRLLSVTRKRNAGIATQYFVWKPDASALIQTAEYQRSIERYCSLQSP